MIFPIRLSPMFADRLKLFTLLYSLWKLKRRTPVGSRYFSISGITSGSIRILTRALSVRRFLVFFLLYIRRPFCIPFASYKSTVFIPMSRNVRMPTSRPKSCKLQSPLRTNDVSSGMVSSFLNCAKLKGCLSVVGMGGFFTFENGESWMRIIPKSSSLYSLLAALCRACNVEK